MTLIVREPHLIDIPLLANSAYAAWVEGIKPYLSRSEISKIDEVEFSYFIRLNLNNILGAYYRLVPVGYVATEHGDNYISDCWVDPLYQGLGIGGTLLSEFLKRIYGQGYDYAYLKVYKQNDRAINFYQSLGFEIEIQSGKLFDGQWEQSKRVTMVKRFKSDFDVL